MIIDEENLEALLDSIGIDIVSYTVQDFIAYCPFHKNRDSPALNISKEHPYGWRCWNPSCGESGSLIELTTRCLRVSPLEATRHIMSYREADKAGLISVLKAKIAIKKSNLIDEEMLVSCKALPEEVDVLLDHRLSKETIKEFELGYSKVKKRITIPLRDENGVLVGISGRAVEHFQMPKYKESLGFEKNKFLFNMNRAKAYDTIILVEGPIDAMKVYEAGFPNVVATLGNSFSDAKRKLLQANAECIIVFTDNDEAGIAFGKEVARRLDNKKIFFATYPDGIKDPGEMTKEQIIDAINNKKSKIEIYLQKLKRR